MRIRADLEPHRETVLKACAVTPRTRAELFDACGGRKGIGRVRFTGMLQTMLKKGQIVKGAEILNPRKGARERGGSHALTVHTYKLP